MKMSKEDAIISNYMEVTMYNKTLEIEKKIAEGKVSEKERQRYKNTFRTEVKIRNGKLNSISQKTRAEGKEKPKTLEAYYNKETTEGLYNSYIPRILGTNDFYRIDKALEIVKADTTMRDTTRKKLCQLLKLINKKGYTKAKDEWCKQYNKKTFRNHVKKIEELGVNILTFDTEIDGEEVKTEKIKNFTVLENGVKDINSKEELEQKNNTQTED